MKRRIIRCEDSSPIYRQILKETLQGYKFVPCGKTKRIIKIK